MKQTQSAFTLYELMICLALMSVFASAGVPAFAHLIQNHRDTTLRNQLVSLLQAGRSQAITYQQTRTICGSSDGSKCTGHWQQNWLLLSHENKPIQHVQLPPNTNVCWNGFSNTIKYQRNGTSPISNGRFAACRNNVAVWSLVLNRQGRIKFSEPDPKQACC